MTSCCHVLATMSFLTPLGGYIEGGSATRFAALLIFNSLQFEERFHIKRLLLKDSPSPVFPFTSLSYPTLHLSTLLISFLTTIAWFPAMHTPLLSLTFIALFLIGGAFGQTAYANDFVDPDYIVEGRYPANTGSSQVTIRGWATTWARRGPWSAYHLYCRGNLTNKRPFWNCAL